MQQAPYSATRPDFGPMMIGSSLDVEFQPAAKVEVRVDREFFALLRANLHAASHHAAMGHEGASFRQCSRAACQDAAKLIPQLEDVDLGATDAEQDALLDRVLAALEESLPAAPRTRTMLARGGTSFFAPMAK